MTQEEFEELRKDAMRYRWLRSNPVKPGHLPIDGDMWVVQYRHVTGTIPELRSAGFDTSLDARIDVAMSQAKGAGKEGGKQ